MLFQEVAKSPLISCLYHRTDFPAGVSDVMYTSTKGHHVPDGHVLASEKSVSSQQCMRLCAYFGNGQECMSFNYNNVTQECKLYDEKGRHETGFRDLRKVYTPHYDISENDPLRLP